MLNTAVFCLEGCLSKILAAMWEADQDWGVCEEGD
jgi:hypothetical protein